MSDAHGGRLVPRDTADRVLRLAIEMEARRGEVLTEDELFRIAREVDVHPEYVRRALDAEFAADLQHERERASAAAYRPLSLRARVINGFIGVILLLLLVIWVMMFIRGMREEAARGISLEVVGGMLLALLMAGFWGGMTWVFLANALDLPPGKFRRR